MSNQRSTFAKRQREQNKKDKARAKQERLAARRADADANPGEKKGPPIAYDETVRYVDSPDPAVVTPPPGPGTPTE